MASYGDKYYQEGDRKITLNFALAKKMPIEPDVLSMYFNPEKFLIKITPLNPTYQAQENDLNSFIDPSHEIEKDQLVEALERIGYRVIVSIGELEENLVGSNCGQYVLKHLNQKHTIEGGYTYEVENFKVITGKY